MTQPIKTLHVKPGRLKLSQIPYEIVIRHALHIRDDTSLRSGGENRRRKAAFALTAWFVAHHKTVTGPAYPGPTRMLGSDLREDVMPHIKHTVEQIIPKLREAEVASTRGQPVVQVCRTMRA